MSSSRPTPSAIARFAENYGWWRVVAIPVLAIITVWVLIDAVSTGSARPDNGAQGPGTDRSPISGTTAAGQGDGEQVASASGANGAELGPDPALSDALRVAIDQLPPGGPFAEKGDGTYREVGRPGRAVGEGKHKTVRYTIEIENGVNTASYGGDDSVAAMIEATLSDPRGWTNDPGFKFVHVAGNDHPDTRIRLTSLGTTAQMCGEVLEMETSCHTMLTGESTVILNEARWVRGAVPFEGDLGNYRQYLINHEFGHAIGYAEHQPCGGNGKLAPIMMQQTISLNNGEIKKLSSDKSYPDNNYTCEPNPWPYPRPGSTDPHAPAH